MAFELRYPDESTPTDSWLPAIEPQDRIELPERGVLEQRTGDPLVVKTYKMGRRARRWQFTFGFLTSSEDDDLVTFEQNAEGDSFRMKDPYKNAYRTVKFVGNIERRAVTLFSSPRVAVTLTVQEVEA